MGSEVYSGSFDKPRLPMAHTRLGRTVLKRSKMSAQILHWYCLVSVPGIPPVESVTCSQLCGGNEDDVTQWQRIGADFENSCDLTLAAVAEIESSEEPTFYDVCILHIKLNRITKELRSLLEVSAC
jgi:hypothetical protein